LKYSRKRVALNGIYADVYSVAGGSFPKGVFFFGRGGSVQRWVDWRTKDQSKFTAE